jgi:hypothetical protein
LLSKSLKFPFLKILMAELTALYKPSTPNSEALRTIC